MPVRKYRPTSPGRRFQSVSTFEEVTKATPEKSLLAPLRGTGGRNARGRVTCRQLLNMILTGLAILPCCSMKTEKKDIFWPRLAYRSANPWKAALEWNPKSVTVCRFLQYPPVWMCTISR